MAFNNRENKAFVIKYITYFKITGGIPGVNNQPIQSTASKIVFFLKWKKYKHNKQELDL